MLILILIKAHHCKITFNLTILLAFLFFFDGKHSDFLFTGERLESIIRASLAQSKMYQKTSRNLLQDVQGKNKSFSGSLPCN